jgi:hypothetical protein
MFFYNLKLKNDLHEFLLFPSWKCIFFIYLEFEIFTRWEWISFYELFWQFWCGNFLSSYTRKTSSISIFWVNFIDKFILSDRPAILLMFVLILQEWGNCFNFCDRQGNFWPFRLSLCRDHSNSPFWLWWRCLWREFRLIGAYRLECVQFHWECSHRSLFLWFGRRWS